MAGDAIHGRMRSNEREPIFVSADGLQGHIPADHAVALLAIGAELASMNIGVTVGTVRAYVVEYRLGMALDAVDLRMHALQGIARRIVVEFGDGADRLPTCLRVAVLAGYGQGAVRAAGLRIGHTAILSESGSLDEERERQQEHERQHYPLEHMRSVLRT